MPAPLPSEDAAAAAEPDQHGRTAEHHDSGPRRRNQLVHLGIPDVAQPAGDHDGLVITPPRAPGVKQAGSKIAGDVGAAELVIELCTADGSLQHDIQRRGDTARPARLDLLPGAGPTRDVQMGNGEPGKAYFRRGSPSGCAFVTNFSA